MKLAIDCRHIESSGIGVYLRECLSFFLNSANDFILIVNNKLFGSIKEYKNAEIVHCKIKPFSIMDTFFFPRSILKKINKCDAFYSPYFNIPGGIMVPVYTTIHDIIFPDMPELCSRVGLAARMFFYQRCFRKSEKIFTVSEFSKSRINYYSKGKKTIIVTQNAIQSAFLNNPVSLENINKKDYILFVGNIKKHKGLSCLLEAFSEAKKKGLKQILLIVGSSDNFRSKDTAVRNKLDEFKEGEVKFTGFIPNNELSRLYSEASLLVQPSLYEGFGIPPLEAMFYGTMALISDIPVFHEIYDGFPVVFFKSCDSQDLKEKLLSLLLNKKPAAISLSNELLKKYSYERTAEIIIKELTS